MPTITSRQHALVKEYRRVARGDDPRLALIDGWHLVDEAVRAELSLRSLAVVPEAITSALEPVVHQAQRAGAAIHYVSSSVLDALSPVRTPSGIAAIAERRPTAVSQLLVPAPALVVLAMDMQDPGNVGALIRSAEAGGATGVALAGSSSDAWSWKALRAAMGSTFRLPVVAVGDVAAFMHELRRARVKVAAAVPRGGTPIHDIDMRGALAIALGGEGPGLSQNAMTQADLLVTIPMRAPVESLNAAVAAALLVYEARRQREEPS